MRPTRTPVGGVEIPASSVSTAPKPEQTKSGWHGRKGMSPGTGQPIRESQMTVEIGHSGLQFIHYVLQITKTGTAGIGKTDVGTRTRIPRVPVKGISVCGYVKLHGLYGFNE
jgi:hypothetical protein